jgi:hypothetical protein
MIKIINFNIFNDIFFVLHRYQIAIFFHKTDMIKFDHMYI